MVNFLAVVSVFSPLFGFLLSGTFGVRLRPIFSHVVTCSMMGVSMITGWLLLVAVCFSKQLVFVHLLTFIDFSTFKTSWSVSFNPLIAVIVFVVTTVSFLVHVYSIEYMKHDSSQPRFMAYLSLFTFMMLVLVTADDIVQVFFGWEGVGLASYLLIGFWYVKPSANEAAIKAFIVNRVGDLGLILGFCSIFYLFNTTSIDTILSSSKAVASENYFFEVFGLQLNAIEVTCVLLFIGAAGKSAQIGLHTWLPDAMEGPTPVSALIHAATMVTAGVFLVVRFSTLYDLAPVARSIIAVTGATTAVFAGSIAVTQYDIKKVIAYSTCSQLGYMFLASGLSVYNASIFHLVTHAFFKALLFLGSGCVIHALSGEQDIRKMGGIWRSVIMTYSMMMIGSAALMGIPPLSGFYSKDMILEAAIADQTSIGRYTSVMGLMAAVLTAIYSTRLFYLTFHGSQRLSSETNEVRDPGLLMVIPLIFLALGSVFVGVTSKDYLSSDNFWQASITSNREQEHNLPAFLGLVPVLMDGIGIFFVFYSYVIYPTLVGKLKRSFARIYKFVYNKWYFDEVYGTLFTSPCLKTGDFLWKKGDGAFIDGLGPNGISYQIGKFSSYLRLTQTGLLNHYAGVMVTGIVVVVGAIYLEQA